MVAHAIRLEEKAATISDSNRNHPIAGGVDMMNS